MAAGRWRGQGTSWGFVHSFIHSLHIYCVQVPGWVLGPQPGIIRSHTFAPKELLEEWADRHTGGDSAEGSNKG